MEGSQTPEFLVEKIFVVLLTILLYLHEKYTLLR